MAIEHAVEALRDHWDDVSARMDTKQVLDLVGRLGGPEHLRAATALADLLVEELPSAHPVRRALSQGYMLQQSEVDWARFKDDFIAHDTATWGATAGRDRTGIGQDPVGNTVLAQVIARLLRAPALTEAEVRSRGADPDDPAVVRLTRPDGGVQWPEFQFGPEAGPLPVVRMVNGVLDAARDPVGAADWWLSRNVRPGGRPAELIGLIPDDHLVRAARALSAEV